jgi:hypothetical protein
LAKASVEAHQEKIPKNVEKRVRVGVGGAEELEVSLHCGCIWFPHVFANLFPSCHFLIDNLDGRGECFGVGFQIAWVAVAAASDESRGVKEVLFIGGDPQGLAFKRVAGREVKGVECHLIGAAFW